MHRKKSSWTDVSFYVLQGEVSQIFSSSHFELVEYQEPQWKGMQAHLPGVHELGGVDIEELLGLLEASTSSKSGKISGIRSTLQFPDLLLVFILSSKFTQPPLLQGVSK